MYEIDIDPFLGADGVIGHVLYLAKTICVALEGLCEHACDCHFCFC
jgi:hypothetical protein